MKCILLKSKFNYLLLLFSTVFIACVNSSEDGNQVDGQDVAGVHEVNSDTTPRVTGIGGIFFFADDQKTLRDWYGKHLGMQITEYGSTFESRNALRSDEINYLQWGPFAKGSTYFKPSEKEFMINYRVNNLEELIRNLKSSGVTIVDSIETYDYGKFVHIMDPEGNKLELWEPVDSVLTKLGGPTTK